MSGRRAENSNVCFLPLTPYRVNASTVLLLENEFKLLISFILNNIFADVLNFFMKTVYVIKYLSRLRKNYVVPMTAEVRKKAVGKTLRGQNQLKNPGQCPILWKN